MQITIPFKTPSVNHLYFVWQGRRIMTKEARKMKLLIKDIVDSINRDFMHIDQKLKVTAEIHEDWYFKNGNIKTSDVANREKFLIDAVFEALNINDNHIWQMTFKKVQDKEKEMAVINIEVI